MKKESLTIFLEPDVVKALRQRGREIDDEKPWNPARVAAQALTKEFAGRDWVDGRVKSSRAKQPKDLFGSPLQRE